VKFKNKGDKKMKCNDSVTINGVEYVPKISTETEKDYVIARTTSAGVFAGNIESRNGQEVVLKNARRIWYWSGAASLSQLAVDGVSKPDECKFPCEVASITLTQAIEIIPCTKKAMDSIRNVKIWKN
jgi:hypothetical protein